LRILFIGDVVGKTGRTAISEHLPGMVKDWSLDLVIINGENSAGGFGITEAIYQDFLDAGADAITLGNHAWNQKEALVFIERAAAPDPPLEFSAPYARPRRRPDRYQERKRALVINAMGRVFMEPLNDPFSAVGKELDACPLREAADAIVVDFHGGGDQRKAGHGILLRRPRQSRWSAPIPMFRPPITSAGRRTAYMSDAGMTVTTTRSSACRRKSRCIVLRPASLGAVRAGLRVATLSGVAVETDDATGLALRIAPVRGRRQAGAGTTRILLS